MYRRNIVNFCLSIILILALSVLLNVVFADKSLTTVLHPDEAIIEDSLRQDKSEVSFDTFRILHYVTEDECEKDAPIETEHLRVVNTRVKYNSQNYTCFKERKYSIIQ